MMIDDNPVSWMILTVLAVLFLIKFINAIQTQPKKTYRTVDSMKTNLDWGKVNKKRGW